MDVRKTYPHADAVGEFTIFSIGGNKYRLATYIDYRTAQEPRGNDFTLAAWAM